MGCPPSNLGISPINGQTVQHDDTFDHVMWWTFVAAGVALVGFLVFAMLVGFGLVSPYSAEEQARMKARQEIWDSYITGAVVARICADGTKIYRTTRGELFLPYAFGGVIQPVEGPVEQVCAR